MIISDPKDELVDYIPALRAFAISLTRNPTLADDMVQDTLEKAWKNIDKFERGTNLRAWLFTILRNNFFTDRRKSKREIADVDGILTGRLSQKPDHDGRLQLADFKTAFAELPDEQREALILIGASGFSYGEAAEMCGVAIGTIKSRVNRGRRHLAKLMLLDDADAMEMTDSATMAVISGDAVGTLR